MLPKKKNANISKKVIKKSIDLINDNTKAENPEVNIFGGEPFLVPRLLEFLFEYSINSNPRIRFNLITNGTILSEQVKELLKKYKMYIQRFTISIDGYKWLHNKNRVYKNGKGSWDTILKNLPFFIKEFPNLRAECRFSGCHLKKKKMLQSIKKLRSLGFKEISFYPVSGSITKENYEYFKEGCLEIVKWSSRNKKINLSSLSKELKRKKGTLFCGVGQSNLFIDFNGCIYPCIDYFIKKKNKAGTVFHPNYNKLALLNHILKSLYKKKKYFICPAEKKIGEQIYTNSLNKLKYDLRAYKEVAQLVSKKELL